MCNLRAGEKGNNTYGVRELYQVSRNDRTKGTVENIFIKFRVVRFSETRIQRLIIELIN